MQLERTKRREILFTVAVLCNCFWVHPVESFLSPSSHVLNQMMLRYRPVKKNDIDLRTNGMKKIPENEYNIPPPKDPSFFSQFLQTMQCTLLTLAAASAILFSIPGAATAAEPSSDPFYPRTSRYWSSINSNDEQDIKQANEKLIDHAVGTITTMFYDNSGGINFSPKDLYDRWKVLRVYAKGGAKSVDELVSYSSSKSVDNDEVARSLDFRPQLFVVQGDSVKVQTNHYPTRRNLKEGLDDEGTLVLPKNAFDSRDDAVKSLKWLVSSLNDPYSKYLTKEELQRELSVRDDGFLGLGAIVETPSPTANRFESNTEKTVYSAKDEKFSKGTLSKKASPSREKNTSPSSMISLTRVANLPIVTAIAPDSPAERAGIVVGDRIAAVGSDKFFGLGREEISKRMNEVYSGAENYLGYPDLMVAKPVVKGIYTTEEDGTTRDNEGREAVVGYKLSRVRLPTVSIEPFQLYKPTRSEQTSLVADMVAVPPASAATPFVAGGDAIVHYELLTPNDSIFRKTAEESSNLKSAKSVGYIRLTRFSRSATSGYLNAVEELEKAGAESYIIDVRNNYGGVIQESMLTAATLLRDPHTVLCYTLNSRGGFTPHDAEEYIVDKRYPGYLLSSEPRTATFDQVKRDNPEFVDDSGSSHWVPPSSYASLHEQRLKRGIHRGGLYAINPFGPNSDFSSQRRAAEELKQLKAQKKVVILMNEGTASAAEVFVSSLHDNGRTVATIGTKTYGKGLIQHTFPMPDGGGLRLTVAEYLTPALQHVTKVGNARYDTSTGDFVGGGVKPDIFCPSTQGIPSNIGADICVGMGLDALEDADFKEDQYEYTSDPKQKFGTLSRMGGAQDGFGKRRIPTQGIMKDTF